MNIFVARQPVFTVDKETYGYELLFREGLENAFPGVDGSIATSKVLSDTFFTLGIDKITGPRPGFINFTRDLIVDETPRLFPKNKFVIEVLEDIDADGDVLMALDMLKQKGYVIALDDFQFDKSKAPLVKLSEIIKVDIMATPLKSIALQVEYLRKKGNVTLLAEKVETYQEFEQAKRLGFTLFQGYFFSKPEVLANKSIPSVKNNLLDLIAEADNPDMDTVRIAGIIKNDVSISYKLMRLINSAYFKRVNEIETIKDAVSYLGSDELKKFISVVAVAGLNENKPDELTRLSITRARMAELMGNSVKTPGFSPERLFTVGLFSMLDAMLDMPMETVLENLSFSARIKDALLGKIKTVNSILGMIQCFERGDWNNSLYLRNSRPEFKEKLLRYYFDSLKMADSFINH